MADRCLLAISKLNDFKDWLKEDGWVVVEPKGNYEVVRAKKGKRWLIIFQRSLAEVHATVMDKDAPLIRTYITSRRNHEDVGGREEWELMN